MRLTGQRRSSPYPASALVAAMCAVAVVALGACTPDRAVSGQSGPSGGDVHLSWRQVALPTDPRGRDIVRATAACDGRWYVAGAILAPNGDTAPALWASSDGTSFTAVPIKPVSAYGPLNILQSVACRGADVVAVGAQVGGAHGNPRTSTWIRVASGALNEVPARFEQYGGESQIFVGPVAGGPAGYLIVGARVNAKGGAGAAVWQSDDGSAFTLIDSDPALESDERGMTEVQGAGVTANGYVAVGGITPPAAKFAARDPIVWRSDDGRTWHRVALPSTPDDDVLLRVVPAGDGLLAVGSVNGRFEAWSAGSGGQNWRAVARFGTSDGTTVPRIGSLGADGTTAYAVVTDSATYELWRGGAHQTWQRVALPVTMRSAALGAEPRVASASAYRGHVLLATDDGTRAAAWIASTGE